MSETLTRRTLLTGSVALGALTLAPAVMTEPADAATAAEQYVARVGKSILGVASGGGSVSQKKNKFRSLMKSNAAISTIGVFSLGKYKSKLKSSQRSEYFSLVETFVAGLFIKYVKEFAGERLEITGSKKRGAKENPGVEQSALLERARAARRSLAPDQERRRLQDLRHPRPRQSGWPFSSAPSSRR